MRASVNQWPGQEMPGGPVPLRGVARAVLGGAAMWAPLLVSQHCSPALQQECGSPGRPSARPGVSWQQRSASTGLCSPWTLYKHALESWLGTSSLVMRYLFFFFKAAHL